MASKKTAKKTSSKAKADFVWGTGEKINKSTSKKINKNIKKLGFWTLLTAVLLLVVGAVGGFFGFKFLTRNDCFVLNGKDEITLQLGESYVDDGAKVVAFGKNDAKKLQVETNLKQKPDGTYYAEEEGTYYITYTVDNFKYGTLFKIKKIRLITFVDASEDEVETGGNG